ncbi:MAG: cell division protein FtsA [Bacteroidales bacterium]|nr:cell division protein FtsA [Bacteroidales bacterium]MBN2763485.1 cell division protein FtsA [Bacteroidales bacterium]
MKYRNNILAAIDIGTTKIVTIIGYVNENGRLDVLGLAKCPSKGVRRGIVLNIDEAVNAIRTTVEEVQKQVGFQIKQAFVGIAGQHIKSIRNRGYINRDSYDTEITPADTERLLADMYKIPIELGEEIIHVLPQNYIVDSETGVKNPVGMFGKRLEANFHIVIGDIASARNIERCVDRVGIRVRQMILEPLASSAAVLSDEEKEAGVALIDIGGGTTDIAVFQDEIIRHTAVIPFGGNVITKDIMEGCSILSKYAEQLKMQFGSALGDLAQDDKVVTVPGINGREPKEISFKSLAYIIQSRMEEIIDSALFELENSGCMDKLSAGIVITGGGSLLRNLPQLVKFRSGMDVRVGYPNERLGNDSTGEVNDPMYSTSIGLLLNGHDILQNVMPGAKSKALEDTHDFVSASGAEGLDKSAKTDKDSDQEKDESPEELKKKVGGIFDSFKKTIGGFFDVNDTEM